MSSAKSLEENEGRGGGGYSRRVFETLSFGYRPFIGRIILSIIIGIIGRSLLMGNANVIGYWVDSLCVAPAPCKPVPGFLRDFTAKDYIFWLSLMAGVGFTLTLTFRVLFSRLSAQAVSQIYDEVTLRTSRFPMSFFDNNPAGRIVTRFSSDYGNVFRLFGGPLAEFLSIIFDLLAMMVLITIAGPVYLIFIAGVAGLNYLVYRLNRQKLRVLRRDLSASRSPSIAHFAETTQGASTIRSFRREGAFGRRFDRLDQHYLDRKLDTTGALVSFSFQMNSLSALLLLTTGLASIAMVSQGWVSVGSVGVAFTFIVMSGNTLQMFFEWLSQLEEALIGVERLDRYLRTETEDGSLLPAKAQFPTAHAKRGAEAESLLLQHPKQPAATVRINDLWFRYREDLPWVLKGLSFELSPGESLGVVGRTGSGKSSLIQAIFRLYPLGKGHIEIAGHEAKTSTGGDLDLQTYRRSIALIAQDPVLFQGRLRENLDPDRHLSDDEIMRALSRVGLDEWVTDHPQGLLRPVEERGKNLSLGERQLLCMARCLLQEASLVIMDEATSAVDPHSEELLVKATDEILLGRTRIIVAHRLSTLEKCDRILWLEGGKIRQLGPAAEVLREFREHAHDGGPKIEAPRT